MSVRANPNIVIESARRISDGIDRISRDAVERGNENVAEICLEMKQDLLALVSSVRDDLREKSQAIAEMRAIVALIVEDRHVADC